MRALYAAFFGALWAAGAACAQDLPHKPQTVAPHSQRMDALEQRVRLLTQELDLDSGQQETVRQILRSQRESVQRIWQDPDIAPAERAPAIRLLGERTADRIRALLNEEQKKKYNRPVPEGALSAQASADVEGWLRATQGQAHENPLGVSLPTGQ